MGRYAYVGPERIRAAAVGAPPGAAICSPDDLARWRDGRGGDRDAATFVIDREGVLRLADRRSEHVACAGGDEVLSTGEIFFAGAAEVVEVSNLSTGYCPEPSSWPAVARALESAGISHPGRFTAEMTFRRCTACGERNLVKDELFVRAICDAELPAAWNFA